MAGHPSSQSSLDCCALGDLRFHVRNYLDPLKDPKKWNPTNMNGETRGLLGDCVFLDPLGG